MIVKVQVSLSSNSRLSHVLIYNKDRSVIYQGSEADKKSMKGRDRAYFKAYLDIPNGRIVLGEEVGKQLW